MVLGCRMRDETIPSVYGMCMKGWIYAIKLNNLADFADDTALSAEHICTNTACKLCAETYNSGCLEVKPLTSLYIEEWDTKVQAQFPTKILAKYSSNYDLL
jgi:hypothetical protein